MLHVMHKKQRAWGSVAIATIPVRQTIATIITEGKKKQNDPPTKLKELKCAQKKKEKQNENYNRERTRANEQQSSIV